MQFSLRPTSPWHAHSKNVCPFLHISVVVFFFFLNHSSWFPTNNVRLGFIFSRLWYQLCSYIKLMVGNLYAWYNFAAIYQWIRYTFAFVLKCYVHQLSDSNIQIYNIVSKSDSELSQHLA